MYKTVSAPRRQPSAQRLYRDDEDRAWYDGQINSQVRGGVTYDVVTGLNTDIICLAFNRPIVSAWLRGSCWHNDQTRASGCFQITGPAKRSVPLNEVVITNSSASQYTKSMAASRSPRLRATPQSKMSRLQSAAILRQLWRCRLPNLAGVGGNGGREAVAGHMHHEKRFTQWPP